MIDKGKPRGMTIAELQKGYQDKCFSVKEVIQSCLQHINNLDNPIGAFITVCNETALEAAEKLDEGLGRGEDIGPLGGIPVAVKDNICTRNIRTTCASRMLEHFVPPYDATVIKLLKNAGAIVIGKTNMDEFAMGAASCTSAFKKIRNPWDFSKVPGGSSGGSAAALAAGFVPLALGSDTGGSIRQSASFCGVVGLKPTYGAVSRFGLVAFASSLDQIGPMTRTVEDCALAFSILKGRDPRDATSVEYDGVFDYANALDSGVKGLKIGIPGQCLEQVDEEIAEALLKAGRVYQESGVQVEWFSLPEMDLCPAAYLVISSAEAATGLAKYDGIRYGYCTEAANNPDLDGMIRRNRSEGFGEEVRRRIMLGTYVQREECSSYYQRAVSIRNKIKNAIEQAFKRFDLILTPTSPVLPFEPGDNKGYLYNEARLGRFTVMANLTGIPALSLPGGFSRAGLPIGLQLAGDYFSEDRLLRAAYCLEQRLGLFMQTACVEGDEA